MREHLNIGSSPYDESCAQVGSEDYPTRARAECMQFKEQLERMFPDPPEGCFFSVKSFPHDFGSYHEVVVYYDPENEESTNYAFNVESNHPGEWDDQARAVLTKLGYLKRDKEFQVWFNTGDAQAIVSIHNDSNNLENVYAIVPTGPGRSRDEAMEMAQVIKNAFEEQGYV